MLPVLFRGEGPAAPGRFIHPLSLCMFMCVCFICITVCVHLSCAQLRFRESKNSPSVSSPAPFTSPSHDTGIGRRYFFVCFAPLFCFSLTLFVSQHSANSEVSGEKSCQSSSKGDCICSQAHIWYSFTLFQNIYITNALQRWNKQTLTVLTLFFYANSHHHWLAWQIPSRWGFSFRQSQTVCDVEWRYSSSCWR